jgi:hypothetical protein
VGWVDTILGKNWLHKVVKIGTLVVPIIAALASDCVEETQYLVPSFVAGFVAMSCMIYYNIDKARKAH